MSIDPGSFVDPDEAFARQYDPDNTPGLAPKVASDEVHHELRNAMIAAFVTAAIAAKALDWKAQAKKWQDDGWDGPSFRKNVSGPFGKMIAANMVGHLIAGAVEGRRRAQIHLRTPITQGEWMRVVRPWAETYASTIGTDLATTSELATKEALQDFINRKMSPTSVATKLKDAFGLDARSSKAFLALSDKPGKGMDARDISAQYLRQRAEIVADVHLMTSFNFGRQLLFKQAMLAGNLPKDERKVWVTAIDERTCETCAPMDGVAVPMMDAFSVLMPVPKTFKGKGRPTQTLLVPPIHPNCRCTIVPESTFREGIITRTARFDDTGEPHHLARQVSDLGDLIFQKKYDPEQKRDKRGRWITISGVLGGTAAGVVGHERHKRLRSLKPVTESDLASHFPPQNIDYFEMKSLAFDTPDGTDLSKEASRLSVYFPHVIKEHAEFKFPEIEKLLKPNQHTLYRAISFNPNSGPHEPRGGDAFKELARHLVPGNSMEFPLTNWSTEGHVVAGMYGAALGDTQRRTIVFEAAPGTIGSTLYMPKNGNSDTAMSDWVAKGNPEVHSVKILRGTAKDPRLIKVVLTAATLRKQFNPTQPRDRHGRWRVPQEKIDTDVLRWLNDRHDGGQVGTGLQYIRDTYDTRRNKFAFGRVYEKYSRPAEVPLWRGLHVSPEQAEKMSRTGKTMSLRLTSFSESPKVARSFATARAKQHGGEPVVVRVLPGAKALSMKPLYNRRTDTFLTHRRKKEWVMHGRYRVLASHHENGVRVIEVRQIKTRSST